MTMFSDTLPPASGQTSATAASRSPASSGTSGRTGNTVSRVALTERSRSIMGEYPSTTWARIGLSLIVMDGSRDGISSVGVLEQRHALDHGVGLQRRVVAGLLSLKLGDGLDHVQVFRIRTFSLRRQ